MQASRYFNVRLASLPHFLSLTHRCNMGGGWYNNKWGGARKKWGGTKKRYYKKKPSVSSRAVAEKRYEDHSAGGGGLPSFPATQTVSMRFAGYANISTMAVLGTNNVYSANSAYDPDVTSLGGFSAMGWDEWSAFYNHYCVDSATITATFTIAANVAPSATPVFCYIKLVDETTDDSENFQVWCCNGNTTWKQAAQGTNANVFSLKKHYNTRSFFKIEDPQDALERLGAPVTSNPTERAYFQVGMCSGTNAAPVPPGEATEYPCFVNVLITYNVTFSEPKALAH